MKRVSLAIWPILLLLVSMSSVQGSASLAKYLFPVLGPAGMTAWRLVFSCIMLSLVFKPWKKKITKQAALPIVIYGIALGCMNLSFYYAIQRIPLGVTVAIELIGPISVAMFMSRRLWDFVWLGLAVFGLVMLLPLHEASADLDPIGILLALIAGAGWASYIVFGRWAGSVHGSSSVALGTMIAMLFVFPLGVWTSGDVMFSPDIIPMAFLVAFLASALPYGIEMIVMPRLPAQTFSTLMSLSPVLASLSGFIFLSERLSTIQWFAIVCIVISSVGTVLSINRRKPPVLKETDNQELAEVSNNK
ncbi:EamA family transporter [Zophobihabitans entericus]|uniref:EamA family transporter n=1 Tax=Zophobihabitans entericus TaxID=1635327 RepID=A0A6G9IEJ3_9GAMM|nr:EamA family transporter [Zophobihabitans entericus]QIQ22247.1 EamA family transporter [Zophobihabitans entericus]